MKKTKQNKAKYKKKKLHTSFWIIFYCNGDDDDVDGNRDGDGKSADKIQWKVDCTKGDWDFDSGGDCDSENNVEDNYHRGSNGVGRNFMDSDGE